jgi:hypothetical protein
MRRTGAVNGSICEPFDLAEVPASSRQVGDASVGPVLA